MTGIARTYFMGARQTGRTVSLVEALKDGDRVIFTNNREAERVKRLVKERGIKIDCMVVDPATPERLFEHPQSVGRTIFDHSWVEDFYLNGIERRQKDMAQWERDLSGTGEAHRETRRAAMEIRKFNR